MLKKTWHQTRKGHKTAPPPSIHRVRGIFRKFDTKPTHHTSQDTTLITSETSWTTNLTGRHAVVPKKMPKSVLPLA